MASAFDSLAVRENDVFGARRKGRRLTDAVLGGGAGKLAGLRRIFHWRDDLCHARLPRRVTCGPSSRRFLGASQGVGCVIRVSRGEAPPHSNKQGPRLRAAIHGPDGAGPFS